MNNEHGTNVVEAVFVAYTPDIKASSSEIVRDARRKSRKFSRVALWFSLVAALMNALAFFIGSDHVVDRVMNVLLVPVMLWLVVSNAMYLRRTRETP